MATRLRILAFGAHPDDVEMRCSGTLALLKQAGSEVAIATVTGGEGGSVGHNADDTRRIRLAEAQNAADVINATYYCAGGHDMDVDFSHDLRVKVTHVIRQFRPDVVITCGPMDYHPDHEETSRLVRAACFFAPIPNYPEQTLPPISRVPYLYYMSVKRDHFGQPVSHNIYIDVTSARDTKEAMLACHTSQREWLLTHNKIDNYILHMQEKEEYFGRQIGVEAAEAFRQHLGDGYPQKNILAELLSKQTHLPTH